MVAFVALCGSFTVNPLVGASIFYKAKPDSLCYSFAAAFDT
jgi:hypothetical protein